MSSLLNMANAINKILLEAELKDLSNSFQVNDEIVLDTGAGSYKYRVSGPTVDLGGIKATPVKSAKGDDLMININSYDGKSIIVGSLKGNSTSYAGKRIPVVSVYVGLSKYKIPVQDIKNIDVALLTANTTNSNGVTTNSNGVEVEDLDVQVEDYYNVLQTLNANDSLHILIRNPVSGTVRADADFGDDNEIAFTVNTVSPTYIQCSLSDVSGPQSSYYNDNLNRSNIIITPKSLVVENGDIVFNLKLKTLKETKSFKLTNIHDITVNLTSNSEEGSEPESTLSREELLKLLYGDKTMRDLVNRQPSIKDVITKASPTGLAQVYNAVKSAKVSGAYLKVNSKVFFKLLSDNVVGDANNRLTKDNRPVLGTIYRDKMIKVNDIDKPHWEIELKEELKDNQYNVDFTWCRGRNLCVSKGSGLIKITDIKK
jgi:hypothetical protein